MSAAPALHVGQLRRIHPNIFPSTQDFEISIVCIPDASLRSTKSSSRSSWLWLQNLPNPIPPSQVLEFTYDLADRGESIWQWFEDAGDSLRSSLINDGKSFDLFKKRVVFISHALGGLVLKRALINLHKDYFIPAHQPLLNVYSGLVFLGTPHPTFSHRQEWSLLSPNLKFSLNVSKALLAQAEIENAVAANTSKKFQEIGIDLPVLSAYESKKTKVRGGWINLRRKLLVDRILAETHLTHETLIRVEADHGTICSPSRESDLCLELGIMLDEVSKQPIQPVMQAGCSSSSQSKGQWADTLSHDTSIAARGPHASGREPALGLTDASSYQKTSTMSDFVVPKRVPKLPCRKVDSLLPSPEFLSRDDILSTIDAALLPRPEPRSALKPGKLRSFALCGMGGVGKTQIAIQFALTRKEHFDAVFWVQADERQKLDRDISQIATHLELANAVEAEDQVVSRNIAISWLSEPHRNAHPAVNADGEALPEVPDANWLIIFDNADKPEILRGDWLSGISGSILITSRDPAAKTNLYFGIGIEVECLAIEDAARLLRRLTSSVKTPNIIDDSLALARRLGGLPLAVSQVAALILRRNMSFKEFFEYYEKEVHISEITRDHPGLQPNHYNHTLFTTWALEGLDREALDLLNVLSLLDPDRADEFIFDVEDDAPSLTVSIPKTKSSYLAARTLLFTCSLIKRNLDREYLVIHRLVQDVARARLKPVEYRDVFDMALTLLVRALPEREQFSHDTSTWKKTDTIVPHASNLKTLYFMRKDWDLNTASRRQFAHLIQVTGWHLLERGDLRDAEPLLMEALTMCRKNPDDMTEILADALKSLMTLSAETMRDPAEILKFAQEHFKLRMQLNDQSQLAIDNLAMAHGDLGEAYMVSGQYEKSIEHCRKSQDMDFLQPDIVAGMGWPHFAFIHEGWSLLGLGRYSEAVERMQMTLAFREQRYGLDEPPAFKLGLLLQIVGIAKSKQNQMEESLAAHQKALANFRGTVGVKNLRTCQVYVKLGEHHARMGNFEVASKYLDDALHGLESHSYYTKQLARTQFLIAELHLSEGDNSGAAEPMRKAKSLYQRLVPTYNSATSLSRDLFDAIVDITSR